MRQGEVAEISAVEHDRPVGRMDLRLRPRLHHSNKLKLGDCGRHVHTVTFPTGSLIWDMAVKQGKLWQGREFSSTVRGGFR
jgi:hypothetical protein